MGRGASPTRGLRGEKEDEVRDARRKRKGGRGRGECITSEYFFEVVHDEVEQLIVTLECASDCRRGDQG